MPPLTPVSGLPAATSANASVAYTIGEVWGTYARDDPNQSEILRGTGNILANFNANVMTLSLDVNVLFSGADVLNINNAQLTLNRSLNQFNLLPTQSGTVIDYAAGYTGDLVNNADGTQTGGGGGIAGSFFGPGASEVGGVIRHMHGDNEGRTDIGFIGKKR